MRFAAPLAALALAGIAWIGCWQEVQLVRLKRQVSSQAVSMPPVKTSPGTKGRAASLRRTSWADGASAERGATSVQHPPTRAAISQLDQLRSLLVEREEAIADAREAAGEYGISEGTPEMDLAILQATQDFDRAIIKLAGPAAERQIALSAPPSAAVPPDVPVAPVPSVVMIPAPSAPATNVYVSVVAPVTVYAAAPASAPDLAPADYPVQPVIYGGLGASFGLPGRTGHHRLSAADKVKFFTASAGIPLSGSPMGSIVATNPLLLSRQRTASAASGR